MDQPFELRRHGAVIKVSTKIGQLSVTDDCNIQYGVDRHGDGVVVGLDFRSSFGGYLRSVPNQVDTGSSTGYG